MNFERQNAFAYGENHPVVDFLLMCALKSLFCGLSAYSAKNPLSTGLEFVRRYAQGY